METISILMPCRNSAHTVGEAIRSLLAQTFKEWRLYLFDDASEDESVDVASRFDDSRIEIIRSGQHHGYVHYLNEGMERSSGSLIARMDADDLAMPRRFELQLKAFRLDPDLALCGTWAKSLLEDPSLHGPKRIAKPRNHAELQARAFYECPFIHPTIMWKRRVFEERGWRYDAAFSPAEDYELWSRALPAVKGVNLPRCLLNYRVHAGQISRTAREQKLQAVRRIHQRHLKELGFTLSDEELTFHQDVFSGCWQPGEAFASRVMSWLETLWQSNRERRTYPVIEFERELAERWMNVCAACHTDKRAGWLHFQSGPLAKRVSWLTPSLWKFMLTTWSDR